MMSLAHLSHPPTTPFVGFNNIALSNTPQTALDTLRTAVDGRLFPGVPLAYPCFHNEGGSDCHTVQSQYLNETYRADNFGAFINTQWETCQSTGAQCLLDSSDPNNPNATSGHCELGSIAQYFIDVRDANDVVAAFKFSRQTNIPLVIKNTGHDYKGRSSAPNSIALWMHNLKDMSYNPDFVPQGCSISQPAVTFGAGVQWAEAYQFADTHNITLVGGSDRSVGVVGGWLQGGGHSVLSNTMGLGVDRVLQFKVITPDGESRVVNGCQNQDLFFALRGGGGGTFGVVLEATVLASPPVALQTVIISWAVPNRTLTAELWNILADNGLAWAADGWGGFSTAEVAILVNPTLNLGQATASMAPLIDFGNRLQQDGVSGVQVVVITFPTFLAFFNAFTLEHVASVGTPVALASRLIPKSNLQTPANRSALVDAFMHTNDAGPGMIILLTPPTSYAYQLGGTSVTDAWRHSVYHVTAVASWVWDATTTEKKAAYHSVSSAIDNLRNITADAAYLNEADVYEPNHEVAFWGSNYPRLLKIKQKYDPLNLLDCWQCVGWNPQSRRFSCYL
ncbi:hypothetical protein C8F04DRAFT_484826 [Mycena alexandri]|uniref:FAD-binding PCMH-type domain-containing protein n=1 Tax=Mycena alexandri TaxID=1745969 RepID=A0AAD6RXA5_9AGAR|nr:hypothetical protein C8F04DRAFT_484826 [Mycena alexandri]